MGSARGCLALWPANEHFALFGPLHRRVGATRDSVWLALAVPFHALLTSQPIQRLHPEHPAGCKSRRGNNNTSCSQFTGSSKHTDNPSKPRCYGADHATIVKRRL